MSLLVTIASEVSYAVSAAAAAAAVLLSVRSLRRAVASKRLLSELATTNSLVSAELLKFYRNKELSDSDVRAIMRAISKEIEREMVAAPDKRRRELQNAETMAQQETRSTGHRFFMELAEAAEKRLERV